MTSRSIPLILLGAVVLFSGTAVAQDRQADDVVTQQLFQQYVARNGKISTKSVRAATHLVAERGRETGFWKNVLAELKRNDQQSEIGCVRVLAKMLEMDAWARDSIRSQKETGKVRAMIQAVYLGPEVVTELLKQGRKADRNRIDDYTIALARARVPEARDFFKSILRAKRGTTKASIIDPIQAKADDPPPTGPYHTESTRFHAAVGLAQLGDSEGLDWLIANCEFQGTVELAWPQGCASSDLGMCCLEALRHFSGERSRTSKAEWAAWSKTVDKKHLLDHPVVFYDP